MANDVVNKVAKEVTDNVANKVADNVADSVTNGVANDNGESMSTLKRRSKERKRKWERGKEYN